mgnify:CR=1 FL=1
MTDAIATEISGSRNVHAFRFRGRRFDCGSKSGFLQATVAFGLGRDDLREEFLDFLQGVLETERPTPAKLRAAQG